jgi:DNA-binding MarR family transcriptional regulator
VLKVLEAVRAFSDAMDRMHSSMKGEMAMNATDLAALRFMIMRERAGTPVSPHQIARHLRISTASTTKLLDRMQAAGHVQRQPHPQDRRARMLVLTDVSKREFYRHFGERLNQMRAVSERYTDEELQLIARFIGEISHVLDPGAG